MSCPSCDHKQSISEQKVQRLVEEQLQFEDNQVKDHLRKDRLAICQNCNQLWQHTCLKCGCFIEFRASLANKCCPLQKW